MNPTAAWADSVTGGGWAADTNVPIMVTTSEELRPAVADALTRQQPTETVLFGRTAALSEGVAQSVPNANRVFGPERSATAAAIAEQLWTSDSDRHVIVNGFLDAGWIYALPAAGICGRLRRAVAGGRCGTDTVANRGGGFVVSWPPR